MGIKYAIIIPQDADATEKYAANELAKYFFLISGQESVVKNESDAFSVRDRTDTQKNVKRIYVGATDAVKTAFADEYSAIKDDGFIMAALGGDLYLSGRRAVYSQSGSLYAVYEFLEKFCGVRFFAPDEELAPKSDGVAFPKDGFILRAAPDFAIRQPLCAFTRSSPSFAAKLRIKDCYCPATPGGTIYPPWGGEDLGHNFFKLIPPQKYGDAHPEWFDLERGQLCFTAEELTDELTEVLKEKIRSEPRGKFFALSQNDTVTPCQCERCKESYKKYSVGGTLIRFINRVAEKIRAWVKSEYGDREVYLVTFAYYFSISPPVKKNKANGFVPVDKSVIPCDNVIVFFSTIDYCFYHNLDDASCEWNRGFADTFGGWRFLVGERLFVWNYSANYAHYLYPFYNFKTIGHNFRLFKAAGARHILDHGVCETENVGLSELRAYVASKLLWDTSQSVERLANEFIDGYYKAAAPCVKEYLRLLEENFEDFDKKSGYHLRLYHLPQSMFCAELFSRSFLDKLAGCFSRGFAELEKITDAAEHEKLYLRLLRVEISARFLTLMNYDKYYDCAREEYTDKFIADCRRAGIKKHREFWPDADILDELRERSLKSGVLDF
jgi:hypothetical protein